MKILVAIPTYNNSRYNYTIKQTLRALSSQKYNDFQLLIVYKPSKNDKTLDIIDSFKEKLDIIIKIQYNGYIEDAMNIILQESEDYDITIITDDDSIPPPTWIKEHVQLYDKYEKVGVIGGYTYAKTEKHPSDYNIPYNGNYILQKFRYILRKIIGYYSPHPLNRGYTCYINSFGIGVESKNKKQITMNKYTKSICLAGVNMSFRSRFLDGYRLPTATIRGINYEKLIALNFIKKGFHSIKAPIYVTHLERESLSRPHNLLTEIQITFENLLLPYLITLNNILINFYKLNIYKKLTEFFYIINKDLRTCIALLSLEAAYKWARTMYDPKKARRKIQKLYNILQKININNFDCKSIKNSWNI